MEFNYLIEKDSYADCKICQMTMKEIKRTIGGSGVYNQQAFIKHIETNHNITIEDYFTQYCKLIQPICICGYCNRTTKIRRTSGSNMYWREYACGFYKGLQEWSEKAKTERKGAGNPMYGKEPWNLGLDINHPSIKKYADKNRGVPLTDEHRQKLCDARARSPVKARHTTPHTPETCEKLRQNTLRMYEQGLFKQTKTKPHIIVCSILDELDIVYEEEKVNGYFSFDFYIPDKDLYIEVDGDYFHSNPQRYKNGPQTKIQKINYARDIAKNKYCKQSGINLVRFWEYDIVNKREEVKCNLKKLLELGN